MKLTDTDLMPFGVHKDKPMQDVPASYLLYLYNDGCSHPGVVAYVEDSMSALQQDCPDVIVTRKKSK